MNICNEIFANFKIFSTNSSKFDEIVENFDLF